MRDLQETWRFTANLQDLQETTRASLVAQTVKNLPEVQETKVRSLGQKDSSRRKERQSTPVFLPGRSRGQRLWPMGSQRVRHNWVTFTFTRKLEVLARWVYSQDQLIPSSHANQHAATPVMLFSSWHGSGPSSVAPGRSLRKHSAASRGRPTDCGHITLQFLFNQNHSSYVLCPGCYFS